MQQNEAPLFKKLVEYSTKGVTSLHTPAHRGIKGPPGVEQLLTKLGLACDLPSMTHIDSNYHPHGCIADAQSLSAELLGVSDSFFLANGSTIGIHAMMLATLEPGDKIILPRQVHISVISGLVLTGAEPVYLKPSWLEKCGPIPPNAEDIEQILLQHPDVKAVLVTTPTYYGIGRPLEKIAALCKRYKIPLIVDEAHGAHLPFLPDKYLPSAIYSGADMVVQSYHKTLGSLIGTAQLLLCKNSLINKERLQRSLNLLQSTSTNYLLLATIDLTRMWLAQEGLKQFKQKLSLLSQTLVEFKYMANVSILNVTDYKELSGCMSDPMRLVINVSEIGISSKECSNYIYNNYHMYDEFYDDSNIIYVLSLLDSEEILQKLAYAYREIAASFSKQHTHLIDHGKTSLQNINFFPPPKLAMTPREAFLCTRKKQPLKQALGCICAETISVYPPGIPIISPGEVLTKEVIDLLCNVSNKANVILAEDPKLEYVSICDRVLKSAQY